MNFTIQIKIFIVILAVASFSCSTVNKSTIETIRDGRYDVGFPINGSSDVFDDISKSIKLVNSIAFYKKYSFPPNSRIKLEDINSKLSLNYQPIVSTFNKSASGTATILSVSGNKVLLLTCAHILSFPDTMISYFSYESGIKSDYIESISIKVDQSNFTSFTESGNTQIILFNKELDIALLTGNVKIPLSNDLSVFRYSWGNSDELTWGNFVYVFGFPLHNKSIVSGIVSKPELENKKNFVVDVSVNRGSSGGIVLALRDGFPNLELVGIISWVPAEKFFFLKPQDLQNEKQYQSEAKYSGEIFIGETENIKYGITKAVAINSVKELLKKNRSLLLNNGFNVDEIIR